MNESKLTARKLIMARLGISPADFPSRKKLQIEWDKLVKAGKIPGENKMTRRGSSARPGRKKKKPRCINCGSRSGEYYSHGLCNNCSEKAEQKQMMMIESQKQKTEKLAMNIPKMTKK